MSLTAFWEGTIIASIANSVARCTSEYSSETRQWTRHHYFVNGGDGREGVATFAGGHWLPGAAMVAVFHDVHSKRILKYSPEWVRDRFFSGCPQYQHLLAEQACFPHLALSVNGVVEHRVTAAFWSVAESIKAADDWDGILSNGADLVSRELQGRFAMDSVLDEYATTSSQSDLIRSLFVRKMESMPGQVIIMKPEMDILRRGSLSEDALSECLAGLSEVGIAHQSESI